MAGSLRVPVNPAKVRCAMSRAALRVMAETAHPMRAGKALRREAGFTYLGALFVVMLLGLGLAGASEVWSIASQRAHERELLWVGNQYVRALKSYHQQSPGPRQFPLTLDELVEDRRFPTPRRHLRKA